MIKAIRAINLDGQDMTIPDNPNYSRDIQSYDNPDNPDIYISIYGYVASYAVQMYHCIRVYIITNKHTPSQGYQVYQSYYKA